MFGRYPVLDPHGLVWSRIPDDPDFPLPSSGDYADKALYKVDYRIWQAIRRDACLTALEREVKNNTIRDLELPGWHRLAHP